MIWVEEQTCSRHKRIMRLSIWLWVGILENFDRRLGGVENRRSGHVTVSEVTMNIDMFY